MKNGSRVLAVFSVLSILFVIASIIALPAKAEPSQYTGLIIDARGLGVERSMSPRVVNEFAATVWDLGVRDLKVFETNTYYGCCGPMSEEDKNLVLDRGIVSYAKDPSDPCVRARCGSNPLVVKALRKAHSSGDWVVITREDGKAIEAADRISGFRKDYKVSILLER